MELYIKPSEQSFSKAKSAIKVLDSTAGPIAAPKSPMVSKLAKNIKTIDTPVPRYFEAPNQINSWYAEGEYDLVAIFKMLKHESYFFKATQKKLALLSKSGFQLQSDDDQVTEYVTNRFVMMFLQTGISLERIVRQLGYYMIACSNAFIIKVRDPDCEYAQSYTKDGKEIQPVVGLFLPHPTTMKPKFRIEKDTKFKAYKMVIDKWIHTNRRGVMRLFDPEDVAHFTLHKEDGMILGCPEIVPVIDDIRTLRKIEEDIQLLIYRDLFPVIHYKVENPTIIDHTSGQTELDRAKYDLERLVQDGGIATDKRHEIEYIGNGGKSLDVKPYLEYFQQRVFSGLGVTGTDMGIGNDISGTTANTMSTQIIDAVKFIQRELINQFNEKILVEMALQSPHADKVFKERGTMPVLVFNEVDIEWQIRKENHQADLFTKGVKTIDEVRNPMGHKDFTDEHLGRTYHGLYEKPQIEADQEMQEKQLETQKDLGEKGLKVQAATKATQLKAKAAKVSSGKTKQKSSGIKKDSVKSTKSNSNITKSHRDSIENISIQDMFRQALEGLTLEDKTRAKLDILVAAKCTYEVIKSNMKDSVLDGMADAARDLNIDDYDTKIAHDLFSNVDKLRDTIVDMVYNDPSTINRAAARVSITNRTECARAYNYGYAMVSVNNNKNTLSIYTDAEDTSSDSTQYLGQEIEVNKTNILSVIPPYRANSRLKIKIKEDI